MRRHAYDGPRQPAAQLATVFARWGGQDSEQTYICAVDGKSFRLTGPISPCPSVVFLTTGPHVLEIEHRLGFRVGTALITMSAIPGQTYEALARFHDATHMRYGLRQMPPGYVLTYREIARSFFAKGDRPNRPVSPDDAD